MHLMHPPSAVSCSPQRHPLLPPCTAQSEAFSRDVRANRPARGWEPEARSIYTAGLIESAHTHTRKEGEGGSTSGLCRHSADSLIWSQRRNRLFSSHAAAFVVPASQGTSAPSSCSHQLL